MNDREITACVPVEISDEDVYEAMKEIPGYIDITASDFKEVYLKAYYQAFYRLTHSVKAKDIMTSDVVSVRTDTDLTEVAKLMSARGIAGVPVVDSDARPIGVISEKDFLSVMGGGGSKTFMDVMYTCLACRDCLAQAVQGKRAGDIMTSPPVVVGLEASAGDIAGIMLEKNINRLPVVDSAGFLVGIISRADMLRASLIREGL